MADIALVAAGRLNPVSGVANGHEQYTFEAEERINVGQVFRINPATGKATLANATVVGEAGPSLYLAIDGARQAGNAVTGISSGIVDGYNLDAYTYQAQVFVSNTDGTLADAAGTVSTAAGRVIPAPITGTPSGADRLLRVNLPK